MKILFYITQSNPVAEQLQNVIETFSWKDHLDICRTLESLTHRLCQPSNDLDIIVLTVRPMRKNFYKYIPWALSF